MPMPIDSLAGIALRATGAFDEMSEEEREEFFEKYDADLNPILENASNEELDVLVEIITPRVSENLTDHRLYQEFAPDHSRYSHVIANEIREFGGNTFRNLFRGEGPEYIEVVRDVARKLDAPFGEHHGVVEIERSILTTVLVKALEEMSDEERRSFLSGTGKSNLSFTGGVSAMAVQGLLKAGGFTSYVLMLKVVNGIVVHAIGRGLPLVVNAALTRGLGVVLGPIGWIATGLWTAISLGDPAYKITIPSVVYVAWLRAKQHSIECRNCGAVIDKSLSFCPECGTKQEAHE